MKHFLLHPKYWPLIIIYGFLRLLALLPYPILMELGELLGKMGYYLVKERRKIIEININLCFPHLSQEEQQQLVKDNLISTAKSLFETMLAFWAPDKKLKSLYELTGIEHLNEALASQRGVILLGGHFTMLDLALRLINISLDTPIDGMGRANSNPFIEYIISTGRKRHCGMLIQKKDIRTFYRCLAKNHAVWYAPDQNFSYQNVFIPFFGVLASTVTGTSRIARKSGAKVVCFFFHRKPNNRGYLLELHPALENFPSDNDDKDTARITQLIETAVAQHPEQYLWSHRRFKTRPPGEPPLYPKKKKKKRK